MKIIHLFLLILLLGLAACSSPADKTLLDYEQSLCRADSLANTGIADSASAVHLLSELHNEYNQVKQQSGGKRVRLMPDDGKTRLAMGLLSLALTGVVIWLITLKVDVETEKKHRSYTLSLSENEQDLHDNEREVAELEAYLNELPLSDDTREEVKESLVALMSRNDLLRGENNSLRTRLKEYEKRPVPRELELLKERGERVRQQDEQLQKLTATLIDSDEVVERLRHQPKFLLDVDWDHLRQLADRVYNGFSQRLAERFPQLTAADMQLCLLMRLRFSNAQVATFTAVSPASVSQQKFRLKKRLLQTDEGLLGEGETLDMFMWNY